MGVVRLDPSHDGQRVSANVGDRIELVLPENATTGYQWQVDEPAGGVSVESSELVPPQDARAGAPGSRRVVVHATAAGTARLSLALRRAWDPPGVIEQRYAVDLDVT